MKKPTAAPPLPWSPEIEALEAKKRAEIEAELEACGGNVTATAEKLGLWRSSLNRTLKRLDLVDRARELRLAVSGRVTGRPRK